MSAFPQVATEERISPISSNEPNGDVPLPNDLMVRYFLLLRGSSFIDLKSPVTEAGTKPEISANLRFN